jgi:hypothetical protein
MPDRAGRAQGDCAGPPAAVHCAARIGQRDILGRALLDLSLVQHANQQPGINRRAAGVTIERGKVTTQIAEVEEPINSVQQVIRRNVIVEVERLER